MTKHREYRRTQTESLRHPQRVDISMPVAVYEEEDEEEEEEERRERAEL